MKEKLFSEFQAPTTQEWLDKIEVDLKGADFQKKLVWRTNEGFNVQPFYRREDLKDLKAVDSLPGEFPFIRGNKKDNNLWFVRQEIDVECPKAANEKALDILNKGVDSLGFKISGKDLSKEFIATLLDGILPQYVELNFKTCQRHCVELAQILVEYFKEKNYPLADLKGSINFDPISKILCKGKDVSAVLESAKPLIEALVELPGYKCINVNSVALNNAGAYIYQELGYALAWGAEYMNILTEAGVDATEAAKRIKFNMGVSDNYFMDYTNFCDNNLPEGWEDHWSGNFQLLDGKVYNESNFYFRQNISYESPLLFATWLPYVGKYIEKERLYFSSVIVQHARPYFELGYGLTNRYVSIGLFASFYNTKFQKAGITFDFELFKRW